jgi:hypothetical protein
VAILKAEAPHIDGRRFDIKHRERGADLVAMLGTVMQRLGEADTHRSVPLIPVVWIHFADHCIRV